MMLWNIGSIYVIILLAILVAGLGLGAFKLLETTGEALWARKSAQKPKNGGDNNNKPNLLGYAAIAFTGIIVGYFALGLSAVNSSEGHDHEAHVAQQGAKQATSVNQQATNVNQQTRLQSSLPSTIPGQSFNDQLNNLDQELGVMEQTFNKGN